MCPPACSIEFVSQLLYDALRIHGYCVVRIQRVSRAEFCSLGARIATGHSTFSREFHVLEDDVY